VYLLIRWLICLIPAACSVLASRSLIHYFQLESYQFPGYFHTLQRNWKKALLPGVISCGWTFVLLTALNGLSSLAVLWLELLAACAALALAILGGCMIARFMKDPKAKKPLVFTPRVKRLYIVYVVVMAAVCLVIGLHVHSVFLLGILPLLLPLWTALAGLLAWPWEKLISEMYFRDAQRKLRSMNGLIKIGITGSYGKTSVKFILGTMLSERFQVLVTPASFNTPMGVTRIIREKLMPAHQIFVAEMGARHVGDIKEMCRLVHPHLGVLTSVGPQHLETFKTIERIEKTKYELMDAIPEDGHCFFPNDQGICKKLYDQTRKSKTLVSVHDKEADLWADGVTVGPEGSSFVLHAGTAEIVCQTKLLGAHNIQNILLAASVCLQLGMDLEEIARGIAKLQPVEHRLQLMNTGIGVTIIDDAFNSNPRGASAALKVIKGFPGRRIIITPGMVELGEKEAEYNRAFGLEMADSVDIAILVGKRHTQPILDGLLECGFNPERAYQVSSLDESTRLLHQMMAAGDVVLYENDLPDHYSEA